MKKTLAVVLSALMLLCCMPFASFAATEYEFSASDSFEIPDQLSSKDEKYGYDGATVFKIPEGVTMTVPSDVTLYIPRGYELRVLEGGNLYVNGDIVVLDGGSLYVEGFIRNAANVIVNGNGTALAELRFPALDKSTGLIGPDGKPRINVSYGFSTTGDIYEDLQGTIDFDKGKVGPSGASVMAPLNQYVFIKAEIAEDPAERGDKYDDALMNVYINGVGVPYTQGSHHTMLTTSGDISYSKWVTDNYFLNTFNIYLPTGEGYTVYGREGEQSADGETVKLKYGQDFSFKVEVDPEYDMSAYEVYIYNGYGWTNLDTSTLLAGIAPAKPDEYGYYHIEDVAGEHTIYVVGIMKNETTLMVGNLLDTLKNFLEMMAEFFAKFFEFFGFSSDTDATV